MPVAGVPFTTGLAPLPDVGQLSYNSATFSTLFTSHISGKAVKTSDNRSVKYMEYTLTVSGVVTLAAGQTSIENTMAQLKALLDEQGGTLVYDGRGFGHLIVNSVQGALAPSGSIRDVAWGPIPETIEFSPLGGGLSAYVVWTCTFRIYDLASINAKISGALANVLEFTTATVVTYDDEQYSQIQIRGTLEIPLTRLAVNNKTVPSTVDDFRQRFISQLIGSIDQTRFRISRRNFPVSSDRRTMEFEIVADEIPPMGDPPGAVNARGTFSVRKAGSKILGGTILWQCSLKCTYAIRKDQPRRLSYLAFQYLVWWRMQFSRIRNVPLINAPLADPQNAPSPFQPFAPVIPNFNAARFYADPVGFYRELYRQQNRPQQGQVTPGAWLTDFSLEEGLHRDSKNVTFEASWILTTTFATLLQSCGLWQLDQRSAGGNVWALSVADITGWRSWIANRFNAAGDAIVDFGG